MLTISMTESIIEEPKFIIVIGASAGGLNSVIELLAQVTEEMNAAVFLVMHTPSAGYSEMLIQRLQKNAVFTCKLAEHNEPIRAKHFYMAVPDQHLLLRRGKVLLGKGPVENRWRPSIDVLFRSAAVAYNGRTIGVILTGMMEDGTAGMQAIKACGGTCIVQDPTEAEYPDLPQAVLRQVEVDYCTSLQRIAILLQEKARNGAYETGNIPPHLAKEAAIAERVAIGIELVEDLGGERSPYSCPECGGAVWEIKEGSISKYRCHTGHQFSANELLESKRKELEDTFWITLRILEERRSLLLKMADEEESKGWVRSAGSKRERASELEVHINRIKELLFATASDADLKRTELENP